MADMVQVAQALVNKIAEIVYPNGTDQPSITGAPVIVYQGWPNENDLSRDLRLGKVHISVFPQTGDKLMPVTIREWADAELNVATISAYATGHAINIGGYVTPTPTAQHIKIVADDMTVSYVVKAGDTPQSIAQSIFNLLAPFYGAIQIINNTVILPDSAKLKAVRVGVTGTSKRLVRRQEKGFQITIWANCFDARDPVAALIDAALAGVDRLDLPDGSKGIVRYRTSTQDDALQRQGAYRRDLFYAVEYGTYETQTQTQITSTEVDIYAGLSGLPPTLVKTIID